MPTLRMRSRVLSIAVFALAALATQACGGSVEGTYVAEQKSPTGETGKMTVQLKSGGVAVMSMTIGTQQIGSTTGTYTVEGDKVTAVLEGNKAVFTLKDGALTTNDFGEPVVLTKQ